MKIRYEEEYTLVEEIIILLIIGMAILFGYGISKIFYPKPVIEYQNPNIKVVDLIRCPIKENLDFVVSAWDDITDDEPVEIAYGIKATF